MALCDKFCVFQACLGGHGQYGGGAPGVDSFRVFQAVHTGLLSGAVQIRGRDRCSQVSRLSRPPLPKK